MRRFEKAIEEADHLIDREILEDFIARGWVRPVRDGTDYVFEDIDMSRIKLVCELHIDMKIELDAVDIILSLMDQLYKNRTRIKGMEKAIQAQSEDVQRAIMKHLQQIV